MGAEVTKLEENRGRIQEKKDLCKATPEKQINPQDEDEGSVSDRATRRSSSQSATGGIFQPITGHRERKVGTRGVLVSLVALAIHVCEFGGAELLKKR